MRVLTVEPSEDFPQLVPSSRCFACDVCCRFPEKDSFLRPYFSREEIACAVEAGISPDFFPDPAGCQIDLIPHPQGEGYICPCFDPAKGSCGIYAVRPLDCRLYPLALMRGKGGRGVVIGLDTKCPYVGEQAAGMLTDYVARSAALIQSASSGRVIRENPALIHPEQEDVAYVYPLEALSRTLALPAGLRPLDGEGLALLDCCLGQGRPWLSAYAVAALRVWEVFFNYSWTLLDGRFCLFARRGAYCYMPLPPLGGGFSERAVRGCFDLMAGCNADPAAIRIENVDEEGSAAFVGAGWAVRPGWEEYLYRREDLAALRGEAYKSKRWAVNAFLRRHQAFLEPYGPADAPQCRALLGRWLASRLAASEDAYYRALLEDARQVHSRVLDDERALGLVGRVVRVEGTVRGYTFGYELQPAVFCVLLEVADPGYVGLAQFLFRELCRDLGDYPYINALDDSGLENLRRVKESYRPERRLPSFIVSMPL